MTKMLRSPAAAALVALVSAFLLLSMGGAIVLAPVTIPLLVVTARWRGPVAAFGLALLAAATIAELAWASVYVVAGEARPWIWLAPALGAVATVVLMTRRQRPMAPETA